MSLYDQIKQVFDQYGVPPWIWYPIAIAESGGRPNAVNVESNGSVSYGLFQLNDHGQGAGYSPAVLADPLQNARIAAVAIADAWDKVKDSGLSLTDQLTQVMQGSGHGGAVEIGLNAFRNFSGRGYVPAPQFGGIFKQGFIPGVSIPMLGYGNQMIPAAQWSLGEQVANITTGNPLTDSLVQFIQGIDWVRIGLGVLGVLLIVLALIMFTYKPVRDVAKEAAGIAGAAGV